MGGRGASSGIRRSGRGAIGLLQGEVAKASTKYKKGKK